MRWDSGESGMCSVSAFIWKESGPGPQMNFKGHLEHEARTEPLRPRPLTHSCIWIQALHISGWGFKTALSRIMATLISEGYTISALSLTTPILYPPPTQEDEAIAWTSIFFEAISFVSTIVVPRFRLHYKPFAPLYTIRMVILRHLCVSALKILGDTITIDSDTTTMWWGCTNKLKQTRQY